MQGSCTDDPPAFDDPFHNFTNVDAPEGSCQLLLSSGLFKWTNGDGAEPFLPSQQHVWLHGLHIVDVEPLTTLPNHTTIYWAPPWGATLYMTHVHIQGLHTALIITNGADALVAGTIRPAAAVCACRIFSLHLQRSDLAAEAANVTSNALLGHQSSCTAACC